MWNNQTENSSDQKYNKMMLLLLFMLFLLLSFTFINWYSLNHMKTDVDNMRSDIEYLKQLRPSSSSIKQTEYLKAIGFMENETEKYRDFVQQQRQFIISLLGSDWNRIGSIHNFLGTKQPKRYFKYYPKRIQNTDKQWNCPYYWLPGLAARASRNGIFCGWLPLAVFPSPTQCDLSYNAKKRQMIFCWQHSLPHQARSSTAGPGPL